MDVKLRFVDIMSIESVDGNDTVAILQEASGHRRCIVGFPYVHGYNVFLAQQHPEDTILPFISRLIKELHVEVSKISISGSHAAKPEFKVHLARGGKEFIVQEMLANHVLSIAVHYGCPIYIDEVILNQADEGAQNLNLVYHGNPQGPTSLSDAERIARNPSMKNIPES